MTLLNGFDMIPLSYYTDIPCSVIDQLNINYSVVTNEPITN